MFNRSMVRRLTAAAFLASVVACGDSEVTAPETFDAPVPAPQFDIVELLITFTSEGGDGTTGPNPPAFSLSSLPSSVVEDHGWSRSGIAINPYTGIAPDMAVDYGDGTGAHTVAVTQSGGNLVFNPDGTVTQAPVSFSFALSHTYANPGTYTVTVMAATYGDYASSRVETATITVTPDPNLYIEDFQIASPVIQGTPAAFSFKARGPGSDLYTVKLHYGTDLTQTSAVYPGATYVGSYTWAQPGTYTFRAIISTADGTRADTLSQSVVVQPAPITITALAFDEGLSVGDTGAFTVSAEGPAGDPYSVEVNFGDGSDASVLELVPGASVSGEHTWAESGLFDVRVVVTNGVAADTAHAQVTVSRPPPSLDDLQMPDTLGFEEPSEIVFTTNDATEGTTLAYDLKLYVEGAFAGALGEVVQTTRGETVHIPIQAPDYAVEIDLVFVLHSLKNGLIVSDTVDRHLSIVNTACVPGTYKSGYDCVPAPAGSFVADAGAEAPTLCPVGTYQDQEGQTYCIPAPAGSFVDVVGAVQATLCEAGTYQPNTGSVSCEAAPMGRFVAFAGASSAVMCPVGTFQALSGQTGCDPAPVGSYVDVVGAAQATLCAPGTYQPLEGSTGCLPAPAGSFVSVSGAAAATPCVLGTFQANSGQQSCEQAPIGSYVDAVGATAATPCPVGSSTLTSGSTSAAACIALGVILLGDIDQAVADGTLVPAAGGKGGEQQMNGWISDLDRSIAFLEGPQKQAGCVGVRNALAKADGNGSPKDQVTGPARAAIAAALQRILDENGCRG